MVDCTLVLFIIVSRFMIWHEKRNDDGRKQRVKCNNDEKRCGRKQRVKCNNKHSEWLNVIAGVTQGSVLGPALFLLFISDMKEYLPTTAELIKYADDLLTYCIFNNFNDDNTQQTVDGIQE
jgi:hypothetical protein